MVVSKVLAASLLVASLWSQEADAGVCGPGTRTSLHLTRTALYPTDLPDSTTAVLASTAISSWTTDLDESTSSSPETSAETSSETISETATETSIETSLATSLRTAIPTSSSLISSRKSLTTLSISIIVPTSTPTSISTSAHESTSLVSSIHSSSSSILDLDETTSQASSTSQPADGSSTTRLSTFSLSQTSTFTSETESEAPSIVSSASSSSPAPTDAMSTSLSFTSQFTTLRTSIATSTHEASTSATQSTAGASETSASHTDLASSSAVSTSSSSKTESSATSLHSTSATSTRNTESTSTKQTTTTSTSTPTSICDPPNNLFRNPGFEQTSDGGASWNFGEAEVIEQKDTPSTDKEARPKTGKRYAQITALHQTLTSPGYIVQSDMKGAIVGKAYTLTYNWAFAMPKSSTLTAATCTIEVSDNNGKRWYQDIEYDSKEAFKYTQATVKIDSIQRENPTFEFTIDCGIMEDSSGENLQLTAYIALDDFSLVETDNAGSCPAP